MEPETASLHARKWTFPVSLKKNFFRTIESLLLNIVACLASFSFGSKLPEVAVQPLV